MTILYSSLYDITPYQGSTLATPRQPNVITRGVPFVEIFTLTTATAYVPTIADQWRLLPCVPKGFRVTRAVMAFADLDSGTSITANLGWASQALGVGVITGIDTTALRTGTTIAATDTQIMAATAAGGPVTATTNLQAIGESDTLLIYVSASAAGAGTNGVSTILIEGIYP